MPSASKSPRELLSEVFALRAEAYRRWRRAADSEPAPAMRSLFEELAHLECDRFEELVRRYHDGPRVAVTALMPVTGRSRGPRYQATLRAAAAAAAAEMQSWSARLRQASVEDPERTLLAALVEDARRVHELVVRR